jgi:hypothetical protein
MPKTKRHRGGQKGNQNARKHGFYSDYLDSRQIREFRNIVDRENVKPEVAFLRVKLGSILGYNLVNQRLIREACHLLVEQFNSDGWMDKEDKAELKQFIRASLGNAGTNQLQSKLIKTNKHAGTIQAKTLASVHK